MTPLTLLVWFLAGAGFGAAYFAVLWLSVRRLTLGGSAGGFAAGVLLRFGLVLAMLALVLTLAPDLPGLLAAGVGFLAARIAATRRAAPHGPEGRAWR